MDKLYIFAIGGTGARVLKALTLLLGAGVEIKAKEVVPILIDPDAGSGNKTETVQLMDLYRNIYEKMDHADTHTNFFRTQITKNTPDYAMTLGGATSMTFGEYMGFSYLSNENQALVNLLYSESNQAQDMTVGFTGNPNIGTTVLNQFSQSDDFKNFASNFTANDGIFVISSIFGGTGASGFPLLVKNLRHIDPASGIPAASAIEHSRIGAISVLPYFNLTPDEKGIDANTFMSKTKAALAYYEHNLKEVNMLYYIGDTVSEPYENQIGGLGQRNKAHFVELASALAIFDFAACSDAITNTRAIQPTVYKEFGIVEDVDSIHIPHLERSTRALMERPLAEFTLFAKYLQEELGNAKVDQTWISDEPNYNQQVLSGNFYADLMSYIAFYKSWLAEMADNKRSFAPYVLEENRGDVFGFIRDVQTKKVWSTKSNYDLYNHYLNAISKSRLEQNHPEGKFIAHLYKATQALVKDKINF